MARESNAGDARTKSAKCDLGLRVREKTDGTPFVRHPYQSTLSANEEQRHE